MRILKYLKIMIMIIIVIICYGFPLTVSAQAAESAETDFIEDALDASGANELEQEFSDEVKSFFEQNNISIGNADGITSLEPSQILTMLIEKIKEAASAPIKMFLSLFAVTLLASLINTVSDTEKSESLKKVFNIIVILICIISSAGSVSEAIQTASYAIENGGTFMMAFIPIFSAVAAGSGNFTSSGIYNIIVLFAAEAAVQFAKAFLMPLMSLCMALAVVDAINPAISLSSLLSGIKKAVSWCLGLLMTVFVGMLSFQSLIANAADTLSVKTAKFMASSLIPVVGGAVSDAFTTIKGSLNVLKAGLGGIGIIAVIIMLMPVILSVLLNRAAIAAAAVSADIFNEKEISKLFKNFSSVLGIVFSILICFSVMFIISTALIMALVQ